MAFPTFSEEAKRLCEFRPPESAEVRDTLDNIRDGFDELIDRLGPYLPEANPDASYAARSVHRACQDVISAVVHNQG